MVSLGPGTTTNFSKVMAIQKFQPPVTSNKNFDGQGVITPTFICQKFVTQALEIS